MTDTYWDLPVANYLSYYQDETLRVLEGWDRSASLNSCPDELDYKILTEPLPCGDNWIQPPYRYDGASSSILRYVPIFHFPKWRHPIATARHDFRIELAELLWSLGLITFAEYSRLRKIADKLFKKDVRIGQTSKYRSGWESNKGYVGVRLGANWRKVSRLWRK